MSNVSSLIDIYIFYYVHSYIYIYFGQDKENLTSLRLPIYIIYIPMYLWNSVSGHIWTIIKNCCEFIDFFFFFFFQVTLNKSLSFRCSYLNNYCALVDLTGEIVLIMESKSACVCVSESFLKRRKSSTFTL